MHAPIIYRPPRSFDDAKRNAITGAFVMLSTEAWSCSLEVKYAREEYEVKRLRNRARDFAAQARQLVAAFGVRYDGKRVTR